MENMRIFIGLLIALLQATSGKGAEPALLFDDGPLNIYVDGGREIDSFLSLAKNIENTQSRIEGTLERLSAEIKTMAERFSAETKATEDRCNQRIFSETKAIEERWNEKSDQMSKVCDQQTQRISLEVTRLNLTVNELKHQLRKSSEVVTSNLRPADRACEKIQKDLRSSGLTDTAGIPYYFFWLYTSDMFSFFCRGALIDKRFILTLSDCLLTYPFVKIKIGFTSQEMGVKAIHIHANYSKASSRSNFGLIELDSDVEYTRDLYPVCLYTSQTAPKNDLFHGQSETQILADSECGVKYTSSEVCAKDLKDVCTLSGEAVYVKKEGIPKYKVFAIMLEVICHSKPFWIGKVFDHLDFIESIVWPNSDY